MAQTLEVISSGGKVEYEFYSSGTISPNSDFNPDDKLADNKKSVHGAVRGHHDSFDFNGSAMNFVLSDDSDYSALTLKLDGVEVKPAHLKMNVAVVRNEENNVTAYGLSSSGKMMKRGQSEEHEARLSDTSFRGYLNGQGEDKFAFQGSLTGFWCNTDCKLIINGGKPRTVVGNPPQGSYI